MKIFAIYSNVNLTNKPDWLDEFREKYDKPYEFHITLKQPCYIDENQISELKDKIKNFFDNINMSKNKLEIIFDELLLDKDREEMTIMLKANDQSELIKIQKDLNNHLGEYKQYLKPKYQNYEENFIPHITIARNLTEPQELEAMKYLQKGFVCKGEINSVVLSIVNNNTLEEAKNPKNQNIYYF